MDTVIFALSGYENPERSQIRDEALEMGATYSQNWTPVCTHLICAFKRTPKYKQAYGRGNICKSKWVHDCHRHKKLLDWKTYRLDSGNSRRAPPTTTAGTTPTARAPPTPSVTTPLPAKRHRNAILAESDQESDEEDDTYDPDCMDPHKTLTKKKARQAGSSSSSSSTSSGEDSNDDDDEERGGGCGTKPKRTKQPNIICKKFNKHKVVQQTTSSPPSNGGRGDVVHKDQDTSQLVDVLPELPSFLRVGDKPLRFFLNEAQMSAVSAIASKRIIIACAGVLEQYVTDDIDYIISDPPWNSDFDQVVEDNKASVVERSMPKFVTPQWLEYCLNRETLMPSNQHEIVVKQ